MATKKARRSAAHPGAGRSGLTAWMCVVSVIGVGRGSPVATPRLQAVTAPADRRTTSHRLSAGRLLRAHLGDRRQYRRGDVVGLGHRDRMRSAGDPMNRAGAGPFSHEPLQGGRGCSWRRPVREPGRTLAPCRHRSEQALPESSGRPSRVRPSSRSRTANSMAMSFPTPKPCSGADAVLVEAHDEWQVSDRRYPSPKAPWPAQPPRGPAEEVAQPALMASWSNPLKIRPTCSKKRAVPPIHALMPAPTGLGHGTGPPCPVQGRRPASTALLTGR